MGQEECCRYLSQCRQIVFTPCRSFAHWSRPHELKSRKSRLAELVLNPFLNSGKEQSYPNIAALQFRKSTQDQFIKVL